MEKEKAEETLINIWAEIIENAAKEDPFPYEKTRRQVAEEADITIWAARHFLDREVLSGRMKVRRIRNKNYYSPVT